MLKVTFQNGRVVDVNRLKAGTVVFHSPSGNTECSDDWRAYHIKGIAVFADVSEILVDDIYNHGIVKTSELIWVD